MEVTYLQPYHWEYESNTDLEIRAWCLDKNSEAHLVRFKDFPAFCQLELPLHVGGKNFNWDSNTAYQFYQRLQFVLRDDAPIGFNYKNSKELYYYQGNTRKPYMMVKFRNLNAMNHAFNLLKKPIEFKTRNYNYGLMLVNVHEPNNDVNCIRKMLTVRNCNYSGWLKVTGKHPMYDKVPDMDDDEDDRPEVYVKDAMGNVIVVDAKEVTYSVSTFPLEREWLAEWTLLEMAPPEMVNGWITQPKILGFDIEAYSDNHRIFPDLWNIVHCAFMISCVYQKGEDVSTRRRHAIVIGEVNQIPEDVLSDSDVIMVKGELELVENFARLIREYDPDVISGYNILDFDYPYLDARLMLEDRGWPMMGRLKGVKTELSSLTWESGGYGFNSINDLKIPGRISVDMFPVIKRDHKLLRYNLDTVAQHFLKRVKHDVSYTEMFLTYERNAEATEEYRAAITRCAISEENSKAFYEHTKAYWDLAESAIQATTRVMDTPEAFQRWELKQKENTPEEPVVTTTIPGLVPQTVKVVTKKDDNYNNPAKGPIYDRFGKLNWCSNELWSTLVDVAVDAIAASGYRPYEGCDPLTPAVLGKIQAARFVMTRVAVYCLIDSDLCIDLFTHLSTWVGLIEMSAVVGVTVKDLFTRGQQIRCLSQLYDLAAKLGIVLNKRESPNIFFNGGFVFDVVPGLYDGVAVIDFNSLYPSIMQAYNICYTTLLRPEHLTMILDKSIPDSQKPFTINDIHLIPVARPDIESNNYDVDGIEDENENNDEDEKDFNGENIDPNYKPNKAVVREIVASLSGAVVDEKNYYFGFVKHEILPGLLPAIVGNLVGERKSVRAEQENYKKGSVKWMICEKRQLALKVSANSLFGFLGAGKTGKRSLIEGAMSITAIGRDLIKFVNRFAETKYNAKIVYGDSVTGDTPILCRLNGETFYRTIDDLPSSGKVTEVTGKQHLEPAPGLEVWSDQGFVSLKKIIRHKTEKRLYRVSTSSGSVKVTEDHSLLDCFGQEVSGRKVDLGLYLLHKDLPVNTKLKLPRKLVFNTALKAARAYWAYSSHGRCMKIQTHGNKFKLVPVSRLEITDQRVILVEELDETFEYVYDLETENHHFAAGVGRLIVHNTDSSMLDMHIADKRDYVSAGKAIAAEISDQFPAPLRLELEKVMKMLCLCKKKYAGYTYEKDGSFTIDEKTGLPKLLIRGIVLARRDNAPWLRETYETLLRMVLDEVPFTESMKYLISQIRELTSGAVKHNDLVTVRSVGAHYKNPNYFMKLFADNLARIGKPVKPGERMGYLVVVPKTPEQEKYIGNRMVLPEMYVESQYTDEPLELDYLYYLEKQFMNSLDQLLQAGYVSSIEKYSQIKYRPSRRCKFTQINTPVKMIVRMLRNNQNIDKIFESMAAIDAEDPRGPVLSELYETLGFTHPAETVTAPRFVFKEEPTVSSTPSIFQLPPVPMVPTLCNAPVPTPSIFQLPPVPMVPTLCNAPVPTPSIFQLPPVPTSCNAPSSIVFTIVGEDTQQQEATVFM